MIRKLWRNLVAVSLAVVCCFSASAINSATDAPQTVYAEESGDVGDSLFEGLADFIVESGSEFIDWVSTLSAGGVTKFLCKEAVGSLFSYLLTKNTQDSYVTNVVAINEKLQVMQKELTEIITILNKQNEDAKKNEARKAMDVFFNIADTFSSTVSPIYAGYNNLALREEAVKKREEKGEVVTEERQGLYAEEKSLYENNLKNIVFGNSMSTGSLYLQLINFLDAVVKSSHTRNQTLMENYNSTFEHLWAFDTQTFQPKKEFIGYVLASLTQGVALYKFQYAYEYSIADGEKNTAQKTILENRVNTYQSKAEAAFKYLKNELELVKNAEKKSDDNNCVTHLATGKTVSRKLFVGKLLSQEQDVEKDSSAVFNFADKYNNANAVVDTSGLKFKILDNGDFVSAVEKDFDEHKKNYRKGSDYTLKDFLTDAKFTCDNWDNAGLYHSQKYMYQGNRLSINEWYLGVEYMNMRGIHTKYILAQANCIYVTKRVIEEVKVSGNIAYASYMAFVSTDGVLAGSYQDASFSVKQYFRDRITLAIRMKSYEKNSANMGKVW